MTTLEFLQTLWPDGLQDQWLTVNWKEIFFRTEWFSELEPAAELLEYRGRTSDVWFGCGLRGAPQGGRGATEQITAIPGLWFDLDLKGPAHKETELPRTAKEALASLWGLPGASLVIHSGHGLQLWWLFRESWVFESEEELARADSLSRGWGALLRQKGQERGWRLDNTSDLPRVLRAPGTFNHKVGRRTVKVLADSDLRYNPEDLEQLALVQVELPVNAGRPSVNKGRPAVNAGLPNLNTPRRPQGDPNADLGLVEQRCSWMASCKERAACLSEPEWYAQLSIVAKCIDGDRLIHTRSKPYKRYSERETTAKAQHALEAGPITCSRVGADFPGCCGDCRYAGRVTSPIVLGVVAVELGPAGPELEGEEPPPPTDEDAPLASASRRTGQKTKASSSAPATATRSGREAPASSPSQPPAPAVMEEEAPPLEAYEEDPEAHQVDPAPAEGGPGSGADSRPEEPVNLPGLEQLGPKPRIVVGVDVARVVDQAESALLNLGGTFQRNGELVRVVRHGRPSKHDPKRPDGSPSIKALPASALVEGLSRAADWVKRSGFTSKPCIPPKWAAETLSERASWRFPYLNSVIEAPTLRSDGSLLEKPGYDPVSCLLYIPNATYPPVIEHPTLDDAHLAIEALSKPFEEFPFVAPSDKSAVLSLVLTLICRDAIDGCVPLGIIKAPDRGTGKTLLCDIITLAATGRPCAKWGQASDDAEEEKRIMAIGLAGDRVVLFDDIERPLGNSILSRVLTAGVIAGRLLGKNDRVDLPINTVFMATGNNLVIQGDLGRRVLPIHMDAQCEDPEKRKFQRGEEELRRWTARQHGRLVSLGLTAIRAYIEAGRPSQDLEPWGSFEAWSALVRETLVWCGEPDPALGRVRIKEEADTGRLGLSALLELWWRTLGGKPVTVADLIREASMAADRGEAELRDALGSLDAKYDGKMLNPRRLGIALAKVRDRIVSGRVLTRPAGKKAESGAVWILVEC